MKPDNVSANNPIGIFDSGIGGLTVASAIHTLMPNETLIYFGDTAHLPYGEKSAAAIKSYSLHIADLLLKHKCKMIVIACNTASAIAWQTVREHVAGSVEVINVIDPVVEDVCSLNLKHIGVIGTNNTVKTDIYAKKIMARNKSLQVSSLATPLLAPMIEEGFFNNKISKTIIHDYLSRAKLKNIKALILACTHYPLIKPEIESYYKSKVHIIDSAMIVAAFVKERLKAQKLLNSGKVRKHHFYVSDYTQSFEQSTRYFFKGRIKLEEMNIWKSF
ncbi:MAG: glutamate racemase [Bacteroidetes bacterium]|nr:glutamate racemase [Bacteroidota bacterium]